MTRLASKSLGLIVGFALLFNLAPLGNAVSQMDEVKTAYNPLVVKEFSLSLLPLEGFDDNAAGIAAAWDLIRLDTTNSILVRGIFTESGNSTEYEVEVRRKSSRALPSETDPQKIGLKIGFISPSTWNGVNKLSLENGGDISPIAEGLAWNLHQLAQGAGFYGEPQNPALASWINLTVNGQNLGLYTSVEQRNKRFLTNRGFWPSSETWLYEADDIANPLIEAGLETGSPTSKALCFAPFIVSGSFCPIPSDAELATLLPLQIDMNALLTQAAVDAFTANNDALISKGKNFHFIDRTGFARQYFPWDLDAVFGKDGTSNIYATATSNKRGKISYTQSGYQDLILNHPDFRTQYNQKISTLFGGNGPLTSEKVVNFLNAVESATSPFLANDPYVSAVIGTNPANHFAELRNWVVVRISNVLAQIQSNTPQPRPDYRISVPKSTAITLVSPSSLTGKVGTSLNFQVKLEADGNGIPEKAISISFNKLNYPATTDSAGVATVSIKLPNKVGNYPVSATFSGTADYGSSNNTFTIVVTR